MTTTRLEFNTPKRSREERPIQVDLCGHELTLHRPKDAVLYFASQITADTASDGDRAMAILSLVEGVLDAQTRKSFWDWAIKGTINLTAVMEMTGAALTRWQHWDAKNLEPIRITFTPSAWTPEPIQVTNEDLGIDWLCTPPSDLIVACVAASLGTGASDGQQAWGIGIFLDATLSALDGMVVAQRMRKRDDDLEIQDIAEIVTGLLQEWRPPNTTNRTQRRAAAKRTPARQTAGKAAPRTVKKAAPRR